MINCIAVFFYRDIFSNIEMKPERKKIAIGYFVIFKPYTNYSATAGLLQSKYFSR